MIGAMPFDLGQPPVVFLDIDGVLNVNHLVWRTAPAVPAAVSRPGRPAKLPRRQLVRERRFKREAVEQLAALLFGTFAVLVLSSSWRLRPGAREALAGYGVAGPWHTDWRTDELPGGRGAQIDRWLAAHGNPRHVILDDWPDELRQQRDRVVRTDDRIGLTRERADRAREMLRQQRVIDRAAAA